MFINCFYMQQQIDKEIIIAIIAGSIIFVLLGGFILTFVFLYKKKRQMHVQEKEVMQHNFQQELLRTQLEIQEQTFKTISQEIHDNIGQMLSLAKLNLNTLDFNKEQKAKEKINDAKALVSKAIQDLRDLSKTLNTEIISATGLMRAIEMELYLLQKTGTMQTQLDVAGTPTKTDVQKELILFRIVQEALHNIIKHAQASAVSIQAVFAGDYIQLMVADNGHGFAADEWDKQTGSGLRNMQSRARLIGADLKINSSPEHGTQIHIRLPITV